jgi:very-short-patch-repair endonuclease
LHNQYKIAAETMNEIMFNRIALASLSDKKFISKIDKEINTKSPVTGRSYIGEIPDNLNPISPWNIKSAGSPLNFQAHRDVKLGKVKEKQQFHGYTGLEKKLYQIVMSMNIPLAFYAQYEAGPSKEYVLDGAFPVIKLGVEADGEIWHNNVNKIEGDKNRDINLARQGWTILRFTDKEIEKQPRDVAAVITQALQKLMSSNNAITPQTSQIL